MSVKESILKGVDELFKRYGIKSITMDEIARHLSISKKTLYQFFEDKDAVVLSFTEQLLSTQKQDMLDIANESDNVIREIFNTSVYMQRNVCNLNPSLLFDLKKYHPSAWNLFSGFKKDFLINHIADTLKKGITDGYFRNDIDIHIQSVIRVEMALAAFNPDIFPPDRFISGVVHKQLFDVFIYGILTTKGLQLYKEYQESDLAV